MSGHGGSFTLDSLSGATINAELKRAGYLILDLPHPIVDGIRLLNHSSMSFFDLPIARQAQFHDPVAQVGFRTQGTEYSATPDRPDNMTSLSYNPLTHAILADATGNKRETNVLLGYLSLVFNMLDGIFFEVMSHLGGMKTYKRSDFTNGAYLQINNYRKSDIEKGWLQDAHEDANILTILLSEEPGLEVSIDNRHYTPITPGAGKCLLFGGSILSLLSDNEISPTYHRVVSPENVNSRRSMMYFGNPSPESMVRPWAGDTNLNVAQTAHAKSAEFGLPHIGESMCREGTKKPDQTSRISPSVVRSGEANFLGVPGLADASVKAGVAPE